MACGKCGGDTAVTDTGSGASLRCVVGPDSTKYLSTAAAARACFRRRRCKECGNRFSTVEIATEDARSIRVKK